MYTRQHEVTYVIGHANTPLLLWKGAIWRFICRRLNCMCEHKGPRWFAGDKLRVVCRGGMAGRWRQGRWHTLGLSPADRTKAEQSWLSSVTTPISWGLVNAGSGAADWGTGRCVPTRHRADAVASLWVAQVQVILRVRGTVDSPGDAENCFIH